jgi:hypothetical protein
VWKKFSGTTRRNCQKLACRTLPKSRFPREDEDEEIRVSQIAEELTYVNGTFNPSLILKINEDAKPNTPHL